MWKISHLHFWFIVFASLPLWYKFDIMYVIAAIFNTLIYSVSQPPPFRGFLKFFPKWLGIFNQFLHTYYTVTSTLDYKFLFKYLQLWQSYAILSATT